MICLHLFQFIFLQYKAEYMHAYFLRQNSSLLHAGSCLSESASLCLTAQHQPVYLKTAHSVLTCTEDWRITSLISFHVQTISTILHSDIFSVCFFMTVLVTLYFGDQFPLLINYYYLCLNKLLICSLLIVSSVVVKFRYGVGLRDLICDHGAQNQS